MHAPGRRTRPRRPGRAAPGSSPAPRRRRRAARPSSGTAGSAPPTTPSGAKCVPVADREAGAGEPRERPHDQVGQVGQLGDRQHHAADGVEAEPATTSPIVARPATTHRVVTSAATSTSDAAASSPPAAPVRSGAGHRDQTGRVSARSGGRLGPRQQARRRGPTADDAARRRPGRAPVPRRTAPRQQRHQDRDQRYVPTPAASAGHVGQARAPRRRVADEQRERRHAQRDQRHDDRADRARARRGPSSHSADPTPTEREPADAAVGRVGRRRDVGGDRGQRQHEQREQRRLQRRQDARRPSAARRRARSRRTSGVGSSDSVRRRRRSTTGVPPVRGPVALTVPSSPPTAPRPANAGAARRRPGTRDGADPGGRGASRRSASDGQESSSRASAAVSDGVLPTLTPGGLEGLLLGLRGARRAGDDGAGVAHRLALGGGEARRRSRRPAWSRARRCTPRHAPRRRRRSRRSSRSTSVSGSASNAARASMCVVPMIGSPPMPMAVENPKSRSSYIIW